MRFYIDGGSIAFGGTVILKDINFEIKNKQKIALVGRNGSGKTTLLKLISADREILDCFDGEKSNFDAGIRVGYLEQITFDEPDITLEKEISKAFSQLFSKKAEMESLLRQIENGGNPELLEKYTALENDFRLNGGYTYKKEYETVLKSFGFSEEDKHKKLSDFSGGERTKIAFVKLLLSKPDILLLDEPTNHLDAKTTEWLENYLISYPKAIIFVSHDRMFLDKVAEIIYDIDRGRIKRYHGNYSAFRKSKREEYERLAKEYAAQEKEIKKEKELIERFRYKATKAAMVQSRIKALERRALIPPPAKIDLKSFYTDTSPDYESASDVLICKNLKIGYEKPLLEVDFSLHKGRKLGVIGKNGTGKTTLLKTLVGKIPALGGSYSFGGNVKIGYFDQKIAAYTGMETVLDNYRNEFPDLTRTQAQNDLAAFLFTGEDVFKPIEVLSGGEKVRLSLCKIFKNRPNLLILDEPTNHTDLEGKEALEEMLKNYSGTIICVSHDRYFIKNLCDCILSFNEESATFYEGDYESFLRKTELQAQAPVAEEQREKPVAAGKSKRFSPLKEYSKTKAKREKTEEKIALKELEIEGINAEINSDEVSSDYLKLSQLSDEITDKKTELSILMDEWEALCLKEAELENSLNN